MSIKINGQTLSFNDNELATAQQTKFPLVDLLGECSSLHEAVFLSSVFKNRAIRAQDFEAAVCFRSIEKQLKDQLEINRESTAQLVQTELEAAIEQTAEKAYHKFVARLSNQD